MWPRASVAEVVNAMADHGLVVLGLDLRSDGDGVTPAGLATEIPWSAYQHDRSAHTDPVEGGRADALLALARPNLHEFAEYPWILITWLDLTSFRGVIEKDG
jgi:hypothetical protein